MLQLKFDYYNAIGKAVTRALEHGGKPAVAFVNKDKWCHTWPHHMYVCGLRIRIVALTAIPPDCVYMADHAQAVRFIHSLRLARALLRGYQPRLMLILGKRHEPN